MLQNIASQKEANTVLLLSISVKVLFLPILFLEEGFMRLCRSQKYLGRLLYADDWKNIIHSNLQKLPAPINNLIFLHTLILLYISSILIPQSNLNGIPLHGILPSLGNRGRICKGVAQSTYSKWRSEATPHCNLNPLTVTNIFGRGPTGTGFPPRTSQLPAFSTVKNHCLITTYQGVRKRQKGWVELAPWAKAVQAQTDSHSLHLSYRFLNLSNVFIHPDDFCKWLRSPHLS